MAIGGGVGRRHKKVIPPSTMALISAPASAEFQWIRPDEEARLGDGEEEGGVAGDRPAGPAGWPAGTVCGADLLRGKQTRRDGR